ncbi:predicted protein [Naegleria gruberi]|uniref:Predicted protein n=1 Tax=Naegleria gruberi TaxID=5762 RepID=D2UZ52_NAEGR|nr:uncharacterized protein NAEGRDRAFT_29775 [Naegleria gruberi]EFC50092.1 predicted protein [Naegleria gruberi]|eukprot:XP_002682836.1 predicted protein [Naegleria gruberi strain NEG-M]
MQIFVKTCTGKIIPVDCEANDTIKNLQNKIFQKEGTVPGFQVYIFGGKQLRDEEKSLVEYNVKKDDTLFLVLRLREKKDDEEVESKESNDED